jgi:hypothetical protein
MPYSKQSARLERTVRVLLGLLLLSLVFVGPKSAYGWVGILLVASGLFGSWNRVRGQT